MDEEVFSSLSSSSSSSPSSAEDPVQEPPLPAGAVGRAVSPYVNAETGKDDGPAAVSCGPGEIGESSRSSRPVPRTSSTSAATAHMTNAQLFTATTPDPPAHYPYHATPHAFQPPQSYAAAARRQKDLRAYTFDISAHQAANGFAYHPGVMHHGAPNGAMDMHVMPPGLQATAYANHLFPTAHSAFTSASSTAHIALGHPMPPTSFDPSQVMTVGRPVMFGPPYFMPQSMSSMPSGMAYPTLGTSGATVGTKRSRKGKEQSYNDSRAVGLAAAQAVPLEEEEQLTASNRAKRQRKPAARYAVDYLADAREFEGGRPHPLHVGGDVEDTAETERKQRRRRQKAPRATGPAERKVHSVGHASLHKSKNPWASHEDALLRDAYVRITSEGHENPIPWNRISELVPDRTGKQCRERWVHHLQPMVNRSDWTEEEDQIIFHQLSLMGRKWAMIASHVKGRTPQQIKNRYYATMRRLARQSLHASNSDGAGALGAPLMSPMPKALRTRHDLDD